MDFKYDLRRAQSRSETGTAPLEPKGIITTLASRSACLKSPSIAAKASNNDANVQSGILTTAREAVFAEPSTFPMAFKAIAVWIPSLESSVGVF